MASVQSIVDRYAGMRPSGYLTPEDTAFGEGLLGRSNELIGSNVAQARATARNRLSQRGIGGAAEEQVYSDIEGTGAVARARAAGAVGDTLAGIRGRAADFERQKVLTAFGAEVNDQVRQSQRKDQQRAAWWNMVSRGIGPLMSFFGGGGVGLATGALSAEDIGFGDIQ